MDRQAPTLVQLAPVFSRLGNEARELDRHRPHATSRTGIRARARIAKTLAPLGLLSFAGEAQIRIATLRKNIRAGAWARQAVLRHSM